MKFRIAVLSAVLFILSASLACSDDLKEDTEIQGILCKKGQVFYYPSGKLMYAGLAKTQQIQGIECLGNSPFKLYESGKLGQFALSKDQMIQGIPCAGEYSVWFHESGKLALAFLSKDCEIFSNKFLKGTQIQFDETGKILSVMGKTQIIKGIKFSSAAQVYINQSGQIERVHLYRAQIIKEKRYPDDSYLYFDKSGNIEEISRPRNIEIEKPNKSSLDGRWK